MSNKTISYAAFAKAATAEYTAAWFSDPDEELRVADGPRGVEFFAGDGRRLFGETEVESLSANGEIVTVTLKDGDAHLISLVNPVRDIRF